MGTKDTLRAAATAGLLLTGFPSAFAQNWTLTSAPITNWSCVAMSADGTLLLAANGGADPAQVGPIYVSTNGGSSWAAADAPVQTWTSVALSADGVRSVAVANGEGIYTSVNSGSSWVKTSATNAHWQSVAMSAAGNRIVAVETNTGPFFGFLHASTNFGGTWMITGAPSFPWTSVTSSADGTKLAAVGHHFRLVESQSWLSSDVGATWTQMWTGINNPVSIASSANGCVLVAAGTSYGVCVSHDGGTSWETKPSLPLGGRPQPFNSVDSSADGSKLVAVLAASSFESPGPIFISTNSGATWSWSGEPVTGRQAIASSADGNKLIAIVNGGGIYTWQTTPSPKLNITPTESSLLISWIVPSMPFVLQEAADLNATGWIDVTTQPTMNLANLHHEVSVPLSSTNRFYRLKSL